MTSLTKLLLAGAAALAMTHAAMAAEVEIKMMNKGSDGQAMVFEPAFVKVQPGDTVHFVATDKSHDVEAIKDMLPAGAEPFKGEMNKDLSVTLTVPGVYGVKCTPHFAMGMVALVQVGDGPFDTTALKAVKLPGKAGQRMTPLFDNVK